MRIESSGYSLISNSPINIQQFRYSFVKICFKSMKYIELMERLPLFMRESTSALIDTSRVFTPRRMGCVNGSTEKERAWTRLSLPIGELHPFSHKIFSHDIIWLKY